MMETYNLQYLCYISKVNPYAAGGSFGKNKMMQKPEKWLKPWYTGTLLRVICESYPMSTNMTWFG